MTLRLLLIISVFLDVVVAVVDVEVEESYGEEGRDTFDTDFKYKVFKSILDLRNTGITQGLFGIENTPGNAIINDILADAGLDTYGVDILAPVT